MEQRFNTLIQNAKKYRNAAILFEVLLVVAFIILSLSQVSNRFIRTLFHLDREFNIPSLFSAAQLFLVGYGFIYLYNRLKRSTADPPKIYRALGIIFIFLALDEGLFLHESITMLSRNVDWMPKTNTGHGAWVLPYILIGLGFFIWNIRTLIALLRQHTREFTTMAVGFFLYVLGALALETNRWLFRLLNVLPEHQHLIQLSMEEFLEMFGITIVLYGVFLLHQSDRTSTTADTVFDADTPTTQP